MRLFKVIWVAIIYSQVSGCANFWGFTPQPNYASYVGYGERHGGDVGGDPGTSPEIYNSGRDSATSKGSTKTDSSDRAEARREEAEQKRLANIEAAKKEAERKAAEARLAAVNAAKIEAERKAAEERLAAENAAKTEAQRTQEESDKKLAIAAMEANKIFIKKTEQVIPLAPKDGLAIIAELGEAWSRLSWPMPRDPAVGKFVGGAGAAVDALKNYQDYSTLNSALREIESFRATMKEGEVAHLVISTTREGDVYVSRVPSADTPVYRAEGTQTFRTEISTPSPNTLWEHLKTEEQRQKELQDFYDKLDEATKKVLDENMRKGLKLH